MAYEPSRYPLCNEWACRRQRERSVRFLRLSPFDSTSQEREIARYLLMSVLVWTLPLVVNDLWALWREHFL
jgi:hypothetical protein